MIRGLMRGIGAIYQQLSTACYEYKLELNFEMSACPLSSPHYTVIVRRNELLQKMSNTENQLKKSREEYLSMANNLTFTESDFHALQLKFNRYF